MAKAKKKKSAKAKVKKVARKAAKKTKSAAKRTAKKTKRVATKAKRAVSKKATKRPAAKKAKAVKRAAPRAKKTKDVIGEGNYTASRNFDKAETSYIRDHRSQIAEGAKEAERAMEGPEREELEQADEESRSHAAE